MLEVMPRFYRYYHREGNNCTAFQVKYRETDLWIQAERPCSEEALSAVLSCRYQLQTYIERHPEFLHALTPLPDDPTAPTFIRRMLSAAQRTDVGPMAAVAGAIAQSVGERLITISPSVIVENGGDCFLAVNHEVAVGIYPGENSPFKDRLKLRIASERFPIAICTSSATIGHSLSLGCADAVTVIAKDAALADAAATAIGNAVHSPRDIESVATVAKAIEGIEGFLIVVRDRLALWGDVELITP